MAIIHSQKHHCRHLNNDSDTDGVPGCEKLEKPCCTHSYANTFAVHSNGRLLQGDAAPASRNDVVREA